MNDNEELVLVYGTLKQGGRNAHKMDGTLYLRDGTTQSAKYIMKVFNSSSANGQASPGVVKAKLGEKAGHIEGKVHAVTKEQLAELDRFEGVHTGNYERVRVRLQDHSLAYMYVRLSVGSPASSQAQVVYNPERRSYNWMENNAHRI